MGRSCPNQGLHHERCEPRPLRFVATSSSGEVSALVLRPEDARWLLVLGHGAGAGMRHPFMETVSSHLAAHGIATFRYQFPYMEQGKKGPDPQPVLVKTVRSAVDAAMAVAADLPLLAGGKSLGGRMTSTAMAEGPLPEVHGLVFFGFPLHAPGKPSRERADHLSRVPVPMLFLQGTRDNLASLELLRPVCEKLGERAALRIIDGADHGFHVLKSSGATDDEVLRRLGADVADWARQIGS
ncbi:MAG: alpha/beta family hydrolase [bacterium]